MLGSQRIQLEMSKNRQALNGLLSKEQPEDNDVDAIGKLTSTLDKQETEYRAYVEAESSLGLTNKGTPIIDKPGMDGEKKELHKLLEKVELRHYLTSAIEDNPLEGPAKEFNQALGFKGGQGIQLPIFLLDPDLEKRADAVSTFQANTAELQEIAYLERIFAESLTMHLGVSMHSVGAGEAFASVLTTGTTPETVAVSTAVDAIAGVITNVVMAPVRMSAAYLVQIEDLARTAMIENRLRSDLNMAISNEMDKQVIAGDAQLKTPTGLRGGAGDVDVSKATSFGHATPTTAFTGTTKIHIDLVDGQYATTHGQIAEALSPWYYNTLSNLRTTNAETDTMEVLSKKGIQFRSSLHMGAVGEPAVNGSAGVVCLKRGSSNAAIVAMWPTISLIRDIYTQAAKGQVRLTANILWNFAMIRAANYKNLKVIA